MTGAIVRKMRGLYWWIDRWRQSTAYTDMTLEEQGAYRNLLDEAHLRGGPLPDDQRILAKASGDAVAWPRLRKRIMARFVKTADGWRNVTLDEVLRQSNRRADKQQRWRDSHSGNGGGNGKSNAGRNRPGSQDLDLDLDLDQTSGSGSQRPGNPKVRALSGR